MNRPSKGLVSSILGMVLVLVTGATPDCFAAPAADLPSWADNETRTTIVGFVEDVTDPASPNYVAVPERIAVFDNDGTLWAEQPMYFQLAFTMDRMLALAAQHPEWATEEPFKFVLERDMPGLFSTGYEGLMQLLNATHSGLTAAEFEREVLDWIGRARHPHTGRAYTSMVYQPMLELIRYLESHEFQVYIVSGGGQDFLRAWSESVYGIPPERVVGSYGEAGYEVVDGTPVVKKLPGIAFVNDKEGKPVGIHRFIGRRPVIAFGNSDGDFAMLEWTTAGEGARLGALIHHTDARREWAYDRGSHIGGLERGLDEAGARGWVVVDMARDWTVVYPE
jgi:phosphoglycolate phosphatase-like HAD superfamily hydrolase